MWLTRKYQLCPLQHCLHGLMAKAKSMSTVQTLKPSVDCLLSMILLGTGVCWSVNARSVMMGVRVVCNKQIDYTFGINRNHEHTDRITGRLNRSRISCPVEKRN